MPFQSRKLKNAQLRRDDAFHTVDKNRSHDVEQEPQFARRDKNVYADMAPDEPKRYVESARHDSSSVEVMAKTSKESTSRTSIALTRAGGVLA